MSEATTALTEGFTDLLAQHGQPVTVKTRAGQRRVLTGIYIDPALEGTLGQTRVIEDTRPRVLCWHRDTKNLARDDLVTVAHITYTLLEILPDGSGHADLILGPLIE